MRLVKITKADSELLIRSPEDPELSTTQYHLHGQRYIQPEGRSCPHSRVFRKTTRLSAEDSISTSLPGEPHAMFCSRSCKSLIVLRSIRSRLTALEIRGRPCVASDQITRALIRSVCTKSGDSPVTTKRQRGGKSVKRLRAARVA